jgi:hypothetical protein
VGTAAGGLAGTQPGGPAGAEAGGLAGAEPPSVFIGPCDRRLSSSDPLWNLGMVNLIRMKYSMNPKDKIQPLYLPLLKGQSEVGQCGSIVETHSFVFSWQGFDTW